MTSRIDILIIGHVCRDITPQGYTAGGAATYASITAHRLGLRAGVVTRAREEDCHRLIEEGIAVHCVPAAVTTTFQNLYLDGHRVQYLRAAGEPLRAEDIPLPWHKAPMVLLGPVAREMEPALAGLFPTARRLAILQGWMREWDESGRVSDRPALLRRYSLRDLHAVTLSEEELQDDVETLRHLREHVPVVVLTRGARGARVFHRTEEMDSPPRPARLVDPTGAGDVFAAAFLIRWCETDDIEEAARFANAAASFAVEAPGPAGIPGREQVMRYLQGSPRRIHSGGDELYAE